MSYDSKQNTQHMSYNRAYFIIHFTKSPNSKSEVKINYSCVSNIKFIFNLYYSISQYAHFINTLFSIGKCGILAKLPLQFLELFCAGCRHGCYFWSMVGYNFALSIHISPRGSSIKDNSIIKGPVSHRICNY